MHPLLAALALLLDRLMPGLDGLRTRPFATRYVATMREQFGDLAALGPLVAALFLVGVPVLAAAILVWLARGWGAPAVFVVGAALVVLALGPRSALRALEAYPRALERESETDAAAAAAALGAAADADPVATSVAAARAMPQHLHDAALAPAFWCVLAGPIGAVAWRAALELERALARPADDAHAAALAAEARRVVGVLGWPTTRVVALAFAAMGRSELAFAEWRLVRAAQHAELEDGTAQPDLRARDERLLRQVAEAALRVRPDEEDQGLHLAWSMVALAERAWLAAIATAIAIGALTWIA